MMMAFKSSANFLCLLLLIPVTTILATATAVEDDPYFSINSIKDPYIISDYATHSCRRHCGKGEPPKICHYYFLLEHYITLSSACYDCPTNKTHCFLPQCVPADGVSRGLLTANRMVPGPTIDVCQGDTIVVIVDNRMELGEGTSIHWHGLTQQGSPHMDGTSLVTQCPIHTWAKMEYRFAAINPGTHFWHSHSTIQRSEGLFGGLVIRQPQSQDSHGQLYDYDLPEHYIILSDWSSTMTVEAFAQIYHAGAPIQPNSILINGLGSTDNGPTMPYPTFYVKGGSRYRFRLAYNGIVDCPIYFSVEKHPLLMMASDGRDFEPLEVDAFVILSGERYDFVLEAKHEVKDNFWMRFEGHGRCLGTVFQAAILRYEGAKDEMPEGMAANSEAVERDKLRVLNDISGKSTDKTFQVVDLTSVGEEADPDVLTKVPDKQFYISLAASKLFDNRFGPPTQPGSSTTNSPVRPIFHQLNYITFHLLPSPPLIQFDDIPERLWCNNQTVKEDCSHVMCRCSHLLSFELGDIVEIVLVSFTSTVIHPMHMHGHSYRVVSMLTFDRDITVDEIKAMDKRGEIPRKTSRAPFKDTTSVHGQAITILRLRADNPGFWFFHCHIEFHAELGMALIFRAGTSRDIPDPPKRFPTCQSWKPELKTDPGENRIELENRPISNEASMPFLVLAGILLTAGFAIFVGLLLMFFLCQKRRHRHLVYEQVSCADFGNYESIK